MLDIPFDILPRAAVPAVMGTALFAYCFAGPEIGSRVAGADFLPTCQQDVAAFVAISAREQRAELEAAPADDGPAQAATALKVLLASPAYEMMRRNLITQPMVEVLEAKMHAYERGKATAKAAAEAARRQVDERTATRLARTGSVCGCMADRAIAETRTDWALFAGTLGLVRSTRITEFGETMRRSDPDGACLKEVRP